MNTKLAAAQECGISHLLAGRPCQDRAAGQLLPPVAVAVLCDGAGSCAHSERAAQCITDWLPPYLAEQFDVLYDAPDAAEQLVADGCAALTMLELPMSECYCTMLFYAQHADGRWLCGQIGDGFIFRVTDGAAEVLSYPENGEYANETYFLSGANAAQHLRLQCGVARHPLTVLLTSDGGGDSLYDAAAGAPAPAVVTLCSWLADPSNSEAKVTDALQHALHEKLSAHSEDDLSLSLLWFCPETEAFTAE